MGLVFRCPRSSCSVPIWRRSRYVIVINLAPKQGKKHVVMSAPHPGDELDDNPPWGHAADLRALIMADSVTGLVDATLKHAKGITPMRSRPTQSRQVL